MRFQPFVDRVLAEQYGIAVEELRAAGVRVLAGPPGYDRVNLFHLGEAVLVLVPDGGRVRPFGVALGPSQHHYLHRDDFDPARAAGAARRVEWSSAVAAFRDAVGEDAFHEGGFGTDEIPDVSWAVHDAADRIVAMGNLTDFAGHPADVGLATLPEVRGTGLATGLAADMLAAAFATGVEVTRYRALKTNAASLAVAAKLGFVAYGENVVIRPET